MGFLGKLLGLDNPNISKEDRKAMRKNELPPVVKQILEEGRIELIDGIKNLLKDRAVKMPASDIDAFLKWQNVDKVKEVCEELYHDGEISRTANYRYFILSEKKKKPKKAAPKTEEVDVEKELEKYKGLLDKGLITQEEYDTKRKQILGL